MDDRPYFDLTPEEIKQRSKLSGTEQLLVDEFLKATKALPKSICLEVLDSDHPGGWGYNLVVKKRITKGSCVQVAGLRKKSLKF